MQAMLLKVPHFEKTETTYDPIDQRWTLKIYYVDPDHGARHVTGTAETLANAFERAYNRIAD
jgi:hypothetical protein